MQRALTAGVEHQANRPEVAGAYLLLRSKSCRRRVLPVIYTVWVTLNAHFLTKLVLTRFDTNSTEGLIQELFRDNHRQITLIFAPTL